MNMKKLLIASILLSAAGYMEARLGRGSRCNACAPVCATTVSTACAEPAAPNCYKTILVPKTIQEQKVIQVPAKKIVQKQPDRIERIKQAPKAKCIPQAPKVIAQPDLVVYEDQPDIIKRVPQPDIIRYECPADAQTTAPCASSCSVCA